MSLQEELLAVATKEMSDAIDWEITAGMLVEMGWVRVEISRLTDNYHAVDIGYWLVENCQGKYQRNGRTFLFEQSKDATIFILRWK